MGAREEVTVFITEYYLLVLIFSSVAGMNMIDPEDLLQKMKQLPNDK